MLVLGRVFFQKFLLHYTKTEPFKHPDVLLTRSFCSLCNDFFPPVSSQCFSCFPGGFF